MPVALSETPNEISNDERRPVDTEQWRTPSDITVAPQVEQASAASQDDQIIRSVRISWILVKS